MTVFCKCGDILNWDEVHKGQHLCKKCLEESKKHIEQFDKDIKHKPEPLVDGWEELIKEG